MSNKILPYHTIILSNALLASSNATYTEVERRLEIVSRRKYKDQLNALI